MLAYPIFAAHQDCSNHWSPQLEKLAETHRYTTNNLVQIMSAIVKLTDSQRAAFNNSQYVAELQTENACLRKSNSELILEINKMTRELKQLKADCTCNPFKLSADDTETDHEIPSSAGETCRCIINPQ